MIRRRWAISKRPPSLTLVAQNHERALEFASLRLALERSAVEPRLLLIEPSDAGPRVTRKHGTDAPAAE